MDNYFIVESEGTGEVIEKKSRFIAHVTPIHSEEQAQKYIVEIKKQYWDARHNCFAFVIGKNNEVQRFSDDGEPQGTAGKPILESLLNNEIHNALIIVTRYFGGTLLGTGGLIRAYGAAAKMGLENATLKRVQPGIKVRLTADYNSIGKIKYIMGQMKINNANEEYGENVSIDMLIKAVDYEQFKAKIIDATNGKADFIKEEPAMYAESI